MKRFVNRAWDALQGQAPDLICLSHLRWDFVYQRPQHLMTRFARERRVFFFEEPILDSDSPRLDITIREGGVRVVVPHLAEGLSESTREFMQGKLIDELLGTQGIEEYVLWYYTPMATAFTQHLQPLATIYDCMDELSLFKGASTRLSRREAELFNRADLVFTGGASLYEAKRQQHASVHLFPSSIDLAHFRPARQAGDDPSDQADIPHPRLGFFGVIDERMDIDLLQGIAETRPDWHLVVVGPVVKINPASLPQCANIHYLGAKSYKELPRYLAGWDLALLPFARNDATRFISPTKTPEYLAGGKPVVSTPIRDVVSPYGEMGLVRIGGTVPEFVAAIDDALNLDRGNTEWLARVDHMLAQNSWDLTWARMCDLIENKVKTRRHARKQALTSRNGLNLAQE